jgi:hypothetical protein
MKKTRLLIKVTALLAALVPLVAASPAGASGWALTYWGDYSTNALVGRVLTPDGTDNYFFTKTITNNVGDLNMSAVSGNTGGNLREIIWPQGTADSLNSQSCATWVSVSDESNQEGLAMRIVDTGTGTRAVTVTKNVIYGVHWVFNVHTWDTTGNPAVPFTQVAQFDMIDAMYQNGNLRPKPWRACSRIVNNTVEFKIWFPFQGQSEPAWGDATYSRSATIPALSSFQAGKTGWYIGHLGPNQAAHYNGLTTFTLVP